MSIAQPPPASPADETATAPPSTTPVAATAADVPAPKRAVAPRPELPTAELARKAAKRSEWLTYGVTFVAIAFAIQGMVSFGMDVLEFNFWFALFVSGFLELSMLAFASWDQTDGFFGRRPKAHETWLAAVLSGALSSLHMFAERTPDGLVVWAFGPFEILGGGIRLLPPLVAALLLHKVVMAHLRLSEGRTDRDLKIADRMYKLVREGARLQRRQEAGRSTRFARWMYERRFDQAVKVLPATDPRFAVEMHTWARGYAVAGVIPGLTRAVVNEDTMSVEQVTAAAPPAPAPRPARRKQAAPKPTPKAAATPAAAEAASTASPAASVKTPTAPTPAVPRPRTGSVPRVAAETDPVKIKVRELFDLAYDPADPDVKPDAARIRAALVEEYGEANVPVAQTVRKWVQNMHRDAKATSPDLFGDAAEAGDDDQLEQEAPVRVVTAA